LTSLCGTEAAIPGVPQSLATENAGTACDDPAVGKDPDQLIVHNRHR
jgi:hypothetical protein